MGVPIRIPARARRRAGTAAALAALLLPACTTPALAAPRLHPRPQHLEGTLASGAAYVIDVPADWNGTVLLFSHGYRPAGSANPAADAPDAATHELLLDEGYALAGSSYATTGWAAEQAVPDQLGTLDTFAAKVGRARRTLAWGESYGGLVTTALAERHPGRIDGSLAMCGLVQGGVANWNSTLDPVHALKTLLAPGSGIPLTGFADATQATTAAATLGRAVTHAQRTTAGRARIALAAALHNIPGWTDPNRPRPAPTDHAGQQAAQYKAVTALVQQPAFAWRYEAEVRAGGNISGNTGVDYTAMLRHSAGYPEVKALYRAAGRSLTADLRTLAHAPRITADPDAVRYMTRHIAFTGRLRTPQLDIHTTGDPLIPVQAESAYRRAVTAAGRAPLLRQAYVDNAGHCTFSAGEQLAALHTVEARITTGHWGNTSPSALNSEARRSAPATPARYLRFRPGPYPRPYDLAHSGRPGVALAPHPFRRAP
ncbi:hypothetical protein AB0D04_22835 [Streptomyces sp. NPDC048483]|uniref:hypothetical protein n=1 Tax=Streptomyces sp. NPDC048483 TaxID=3154927 RepID=UPI0034354CCA